MAGRRPSSAQRLMVRGPTPKRTPTWVAVRSNSSWPMRLVIRGSSSLGGGETGGRGSGGVGGAGVGVDDGPFSGGQSVLDEERSGPDAPEGLAAGEGGEQGGFGVGEAEELAAAFDFAGGLGVDDAGFGVGQEAFDEADLVGSGGA